MYTAAPSGEYLCKHRAASVTDATAHAKAADESARKEEDPAADPGRRECFHNVADLKRRESCRALTWIRLARWRRCID